MGYFDHTRYVELTIHFRCNLKCKHCMILETMHHLDPATDEQFQSLLLENRPDADGHTKWDGLILTGSEATLRRDLPDLAKQAKDAGFKHIRIQTHGMRLADASYCQTLVDAGIDEFFVSVTADTEELHDRITEVPGSFRKTMQGLENLDAIGNVRLITNTVVTQLSYQSLPRLVARLRPLKHLVEMNFWNYWPMREVDDTGLLVSHLEVAPYLRAAIRAAVDAGRAVEVKNFPECLLGSERFALLNEQPELRIDPRFWTQFNRNGFNQCVYRDVCSSKQCLGINTAYANQFGWHEDVLRPLTRTAASSPTVYLPVHTPAYANPSA